MKRIAYRFLVIIAVFIGLIACGELGGERNLHGTDTVAKYYPGRTNEVISVVAPSFANGDFEVWDSIASPVRWYAAMHSEGPNWDDVAYDEFIFDTFKRSTNALSNSYALEISWSARQFDDPMVYQSVDVDPGSNYTFSFYAKSVSGSPKMIGYIRWYDEESQLIKTSSTGTVISVGGSWTLFTVSNKAPWTADYVYVMFKGVANDYDNGTAGKVVVDYAQFIGSGGSILKSVSFSDKGGTSCNMNVISMRDVDLAVLTLSSNATAPTYGEVVSNTYSGAIHHNYLDSLIAESNYTLSLSNLIDSQFYDVYVALTEAGGNTQLLKYQLENTPFNGPYPATTTNNYDVSMQGTTSIQQIRDLIESGNFSGQSYSVKAVITGLEVYSGAASKRKFFMQDYTAGVYVYLGSDLAAIDNNSIGKVIECTVTAGQNYNGVYEVTGITGATITTNDAPSAIYVVEVTNETGSNEGRVIRYTAEVSSIDGATYSFSGLPNLRGWYESNYEIGDVVMVVGPLTSYSGTLQINSYGAWPNTPGIYSTLFTE